MHTNFLSSNITQSDGLGSVMSSPVGRVVSPPMRKTAPKKTTAAGGGKATPASVAVQKQKAFEESYAFGLNVDDMSIKDNSGDGK